ncbi:MAG TPA: hypothetical protein VND93_11190 [Myxococcales bacterium]|nr:hypothetical protein [Myxococcales bacterium]
MSAPALLLCAALGAAAPSPGPAAAPAPAVSSTPGLEGVPVRVERRLLVKSGHFFLTGGADYFIRGDYYISPGILASGSYYLSESSGVDVKLGAFISFLSPPAEVVLRSVGLLPDAQKPLGLLVAGYRHSVGYGKVMLSGAPESLLHFDLQLAAHAGLVFTDRMASPAVAVAPAVLVRFTPQVFIQVDVELYASYEARQSGPLAVGILPTVTAGWVI